MADSPDYEKIVALIDAVNSLPGTASTEIDVTSMFANRVMVKKLKYSDVSAIVEKAEVKKGETVVEPVIEPEFREKIIEPTPKQETKEQEKAAAGKLRGIVGGAAKEYEEKEEKKREEKLITPKLSLEDQLSDLEKMSEGITENVFNKQQKLIIAEEVRALSYIAAREDESKFSDDERELIRMRNAKIKEIKSKLHMN